MLDLHTLVELRSLQPVRCTSGWRTQQVIGMQHQGLLLYPEKKGELELYVINGNVMYILLLFINLQKNTS